MIVKSQNSKIKKSKSLSRKGFSLIEVLVAMTVFSLVGVMLSASFAGFLKSYTLAKKTQQGAEKGQMVMNLMAKTIRNSTINAASLSAVNQIILFDNLNAQCVMYQFVGGVVKTASGPGSDVAACITWSSASPTTVPLSAPGEISDLKFEGTASVAGTSVGKVTIGLKVQGTSATYLQSTVSLRN